MTDNELKKVLERCSQSIPIVDREFTMCGIPSHIVCKTAFDLINRKQAEIERLTKCRKEEVEKLMSAIDEVITEAKSEAIKGFAEKLKQSKKQYEGTLAGCTFTMTELDNIVAEMVGDSNAE